MITYQDLQELREKGAQPDSQEMIAFVQSAIFYHKSTDLYREAVIADEYDRKLNRTIMQYQKLLYTVSGEAIPDNYSANFKMGRAFFPFFVLQENQYLLGNGVSWTNEETKDKLGTQEKPFDTQLQEAGHKALVGGVSFGFFNLDHIDVFGVDEFVPLPDEENNSLRAGIRFWQIDEVKPLRATLYEEDGYTEYIWRRRKDNGESEGSVLIPKRPYKQIVAVSDVDGMEIRGGENYPGFPIVPLYGNRAHQSELTGLREQIDCYDLIKSGFADTVDEASIVYWAIQNAGGMDDMDLAQFVERMKTVHAAIVEQDGARADPHSMEAPYASREALLERLERDIFKDAMALDIENIASGANTATQIKAAYEPLNSKTDGYEYCVNTFIMGVLALAGLDDEPSFTRSTIINSQEEVQMVLQSAQYLPEEYVTQKLLTVMGDGDKTDEVLAQMNADELQRGGMASFDSEDVVDDAEDAAGRALSGIQTNSLISIMNAYTAGNMSEGQAAQLIATAVGISTKQALNILRGNVEEESAGAAETFEEDETENLDMFDEGAEEDTDEDEMALEEDTEKEPAEAADLKSIIRMLRELVEEL